MADSTKVLIHELQDARSILEEMQNASSQNFEDLLKRYSWTMRPEGPIGSRLVNELPNVDFKNWFNTIKATKGGMMGSAKLSWPNEKAERVALQYTLLRAITQDKISLLSFTSTYTYVHHGNITDGYLAFLERVLAPFHNDVLKLLRNEIESFEEDENIQQESTTQSDEIFSDIALRLEDGKLPEAMKQQILSDLSEARLAFNGASFKGCVVMLGASLEGIMLGTLQRTDVIKGLSNDTIDPPILISTLGTANPDLSNKIAQRLSFEDMKTSLNQLVPGLNDLRVDDIQDFRNAVHPWKAVTEPIKYSNIDQARALQFIASLKKIVDHIIPWNPY